MRSIGKVAQLLQVSPHTLRYYEKLGLLAPVCKDSGGRRQFENRDIERVRFIKRAQRMHFSLQEIRQLIDIEKAESVEKSQAQKLVQNKLEEIEVGLQDLIQLKADLSAMLSACLQSGEGGDCPIIEGIREERTRVL